MCDAIGYIDKILKAEDDELIQVLFAEGYANPEATVLKINTLEEDISKLLAKEQAFFEKNLTDDMMEEAVVVERLKMLMLEDPMDTEAAALFNSFFASSLPFFAEEYLRKVDDSLALLSNPELVEEFDDWSKQLGSLLKLSSQETVEALMQDSIAHKNDVASVIAALQESYNFSEGRARRVAITETLRAHSYSQYSAYMQCPSVSKLMWRHNGAKDPRLHHKAIDSTQINKGERFMLISPEGTYSPRFPRDISLPAGESVHCHCTIEAIVDDALIL